MSDKDRSQVLAQSSSGKIWNALFIKVSIINMLLQFCTYMLVTLSAKYAHHLGATETIIGLVASLFALSASIMKLFSAPAIDSFNKKFVLLGATFVMFIAMLCYSMSATVPMLMFSRLLQGACQAFSTTCCLTIASDSLPSDKMGAGIGYFGMTIAIAQTISPAVGLKLVELLGYRHTFLILAGVMLICNLFVISMKLPSAIRKKFALSLDAIIARECAVPAVICFLLSISSFSVNSFLVLFAEGQGIGSDIGFFFTINSIAILVMRPLIGKLSDKHGAFRVMIPSMLLFVCSLMLISVCNNLPMFLLAGFVSAFGFGGIQPILLVLALRCVPGNRRGAASCTAYLCLDLGVLVGPVIAGAIIESYGFVFMWRALIIPVAAALIVCIRYRARIAQIG